jgi:hypothetical protein
MSHHKVTFVPSGRGKAQCAPDPNYPNGKILNARHEDECCEVSLPYPAPECGYFLVDCSKCGLKVMITAAGRPDDPRIAFLPCGAAATCKTKGGAA